jgi:hypothetical protein
LLRGVDQSELIAGIGEAFPLPPPTASGKVLADDDVAALFGIDMGETATPDAAPVPETPMKAKAGKGRAVDRSEDTAGRRGARRSPATKKTTQRRVGRAKRAHA